MTFQQRQHRLSRLLCVLFVLAIFPFCKSLLYMGDFTRAGMVLYWLVLLAVGVPATLLAVQQLRDGQRTRPHSR